MRIEGTLIKWNDDRGFGFISPSQGGQEVFVHISAFPKGGRRPTLGEQLTFEVEVDSNGKKRAKNLLCPTRPALRTARKPKPHYQSKEQGLLGRVVAIVLLVGLAFYGYSEYSRRIFTQPAVAAQSNNQAVSSSFHCDGRTHCSQMTSCAEATFFLRNCPNIEMDGNHDGVPCERQWCTSPFAQ